MKSELYSKSLLLQWIMNENICRCVEPFFFWCFLPLEFTLYKTFSQLQIKYTCNVMCNYTNEWKTQQRRICEFSVQKNLSVSGLGVMSLDRKMFALPRQWKKYVFNFFSSKMLLAMTRCLPPLWSCSSILQKKKKPRMFAITVSGNQGYSNELLVQEIQDYKIILWDSKYIHFTVKWSSYYFYYSTMNYSINVYTARCTVQYVNDNRVLCYRCV